MSSKRSAGTPETAYDDGWPFEDGVIDLIRSMVGAVVDTPGMVSVAATHGEDGSNYTVTVAPGEAGQALGKDGRIAQSIRTVAKASGMRGRRKVYVDILGYPAEAEA